MNKEDFVSLEVAKMLKEKGYPQDYNVGVVCRLQNKVNELYERTRMITQSDMENAWCIFNEVYPSIYEAAKWLREKHAIHIPIEWDIDGFCFSTTRIDEEGLFVESSYHRYYNTYEEALN